MKRFFALTLVFILTAALMTGAMAETSKFVFVALNKTGEGYPTSAVKSASKYEPLFYVTCLKSVKISGTTYTSDLVGGDKVEFRVFNANKINVTKDNHFATCVVYNKPETGDYEFNVPAGVPYYLAGRICKDSAHTNKKVVGRWTP